MRSLYPARVLIHAHPPSSVFHSDPPSAWSKGVLPVRVVGGVEGAI